MNTPALSAASTISLTFAERRKLRPLQRRYQRHRDLFSRQELARLEFMRWLCQTGRLVVTGG